LTDPHSGVAGAAFDRACREAVTECARLVAPLARRADGELRRAVVDACSWLDAPDEQITALLTEAAGSGDDPMLRASALLGLGRQGALRPSLREAALTGGEPVERFAAAWSGIVLERGDSPELIEVLVAEWEQAEELTEQVRISDPATTIAALTSPWPLVDALITAGGDPAMAAAEVLRLRLEVPADRALVRERAEKLSRNADPGIRTRSISLLAATGDTAGARAVAGSLITTPTGRLDSGQLAALLTAAHEGSGEARAVDLSPAVGDALGEGSLHPGAAGSGAPAPGRGGDGGRPAPPASDQLGRPGRRVGRGCSRRGTGTGRRDPLRPEPVRDRFGPDRPPAGDRPWR
jgi:hypothetical protein